MSNICKNYAWYLFLIFLLREATPNATALKNSYGFNMPFIFRYLAGFLNGFSRMLGKALCKCVTKNTGHSQCWIFNNGIYLLMYIGNNVSNLVFISIEIYYYHRYSLVVVLFIIFCQQFVIVRQGSPCLLVILFVFHNIKPWSSVVTGFMYFRLD